DEAELSQLLVAPRELTEAGGGQEAVEPALQHLPSTLDELGVVDGEERGIVIVDEDTPGRARPGQRAELGVAHRAPARLVEGAGDASGGEIAGLGAEAQADAVGRLDAGRDAGAVGLRALGLLHAVAGDVGGVVEAGEERPVIRHEHLGLDHAGLRAHEGEALPSRAGETSRLGHYGFPVSAVGYPFWYQPGMPSSRISMFR